MKLSVLDDCSWPNSVGLDQQPGQPKTARAVRSTGIRKFRSSLSPLHSEKAPNNHERNAALSRNNTGNYTGLKIPRRKACRFDSGPGHHSL